jgi:hypothetical protein
MTSMIAVIIPSMVDGGRPYAQRALQDNEVMMTTVQELRLPDEAYHSHLNAPFDRAAQALASDESGGSSPAVLRLGLTRIIDLSRTSVVPGAVLRQYSGLRLWEVDNDQNLSFIIVDLRTGAVEVAKAFQTERRMAQPTSSRSGPEPSGIDRRVVHSGVQRFNLPPVFGEQWPSPAFAVTAVLYDWVSNTAVIERQPPPAPAADPTGVPSPFLDRAASRGAMAGSPGFVVDIPASVPQGGRAQDCRHPQCAQRIGRAGAVGRAAGRAPDGGDAAAHGAGRGAPHCAQAPGACETPWRDRLGHVRV